MDARHAKDYQRRLELRAGGAGRKKPLKLPLGLPAYVPPGMQLKDYQMEGESV